MKVFNYFLIAMYLLFRGLIAATVMLWALGNTINIITVFVGFAGVIFVFYPFLKLILDMDR